MTDHSDLLRRAAALARKVSTTGAFGVVADGLESVADLHEPRSDGHGCQWCNDEDWPCADTRHAAVMARLVLNEETPPMADLHRTPEQLERVTADHGRPARFDPEALYARLDRERRARRLSWRGLCSEAHVDPSVMSRLAYGHNPNVDNLVRLLVWLGDTDMKNYAPDKTTERLDTPTATTAPTHTDHTK